MLSANTAKRISWAYDNNRWTEILEMVDKDSTVVENDPQLALMVADANYYLFNITEAREKYNRIYQSGYYNWHQVHIDHFFSTLMYDAQYEQILQASLKFPLDRIGNKRIDTKIANAKWAMGMSTFDTRSLRTVISDTLNIIRNQTLGVGRHGDTLLFSINMAGAERRQLSNIASETSDADFEREKESSFMTYAMDNSGQLHEIEGTQHITGISGAPVISPDNSMMVFTRLKLNRVGTDLYVAHKKNNKWVGVRRIDFGKRSESFAMPAFSPDGEWLYFASDKNGSVGQWDIYKAQITKKGFSAPKNLGHKVNTVYDEIYPYIDNENRLFFASDGHQGYGNLDLFSYDLNGKDTQVRNLLSPYNTGADDYVILVEQGDSSRGFLARGIGDRQESLVMSFMSTEDVVLDKEKIAELVEKKKKTGLPVVKADTPQPQKTVLKAEKEVPKPFVFDKLVEQTLLTADARSMDMHILFDFDVDSISEAYKKRLRKVAEYLSHNKDLHIMVFGHTDHLGSEEYNQVLSHERATNTKNFLVSTCNFKPEMLLTVAAGEHFRIYADGKLFPAKYQRRVTLSIIKEQINFDGSLVAVVQNEPISVDDMSKRFNMDSWDLRQLNGFNQDIIEANTVVFVRMRKVAYGWQYDKLSVFDNNEEYPAGTLGRFNKLNPNSVLTGPTRLYYPLIRK